MTDCQSIVEVILDRVKAGDPSINRETSLERAKIILQNSLNEINRIISSEKKDAISKSIESSKLNGICLTLDDVQALEPRGRYRLSISAESIFLESKSEALCIPWTSVESVAAVPSSTSQKKEGETILVIKLSVGVAYGRKELHGLLLTLSKAASPVVKSSIDEGSQIDVVVSSVAKCWGKTIAKPENTLFQTSRNMSFLRCYRGTQEGVLYPLRVGVLFIKPLLFISSDSISSIEVGRGGSAVTRYIDIKIETEDDKVYEFTNIDREELPALHGYVQMYLEMRRKAAEAKDSLGTGLVAEEDEEDEEDDDYDPDEPSETDDDDDDDNSQDESDNEKDDDGPANVAEGQNDGREDVSGFIGQKRGAELDENESARKKAMDVLVEV